MSTFDLLVLGAGPGGYVAAIRAAQLGLKTAVVDENAALGGTCLRVGCIPSKALLESSEKYAEALSHFEEHGIEVGKVKLDLAKMLARKDKVVKTLTGGIAGLMKKNKVQVFTGRGKLTGPGQVEVTDAAGKTTEVKAEAILLAVGSVPASLPGIDLSQDRIDTSTEALAYTEVPKKLAVIGAGVIGLELGSVWKRLGAEVTVIEYLDRILPGMDSDLAKEAQKLLTKQGLSFRLGCKVTGVEATGKGKSQGVKVLIDGQDPVEADRVLVCVGRKPNTADLGLETVGIETDKRGVIPIDEHFQTPVAGIYAIGDCVRGPMLAHKAEEEGIACVERIATGTGHVDYGAIPAVVYTHPEIASVGRTEEQLKEAGIAYNKGVFPFLANGRARAIGAESGSVKVLADKATDRVLGVHILGASAGDLIAECAMAMAFGASAEDIARTCHAHPSLAEAVKEAALAAGSGAIHI